MSFCLLPNKVYKTNPTNIGTVIFQAVNGNVNLYGTNVTKYKKLADGKVRLIIPEFSELIPIWDDLILQNTVVPMSCLCDWIGFISDNPDTRLWLNLGINTRITETDEYIIVD